MANIPIRILKDKDNKTFMPLITANAVLLEGTKLSLTDAQGIMELLKIIPGYDVTKNQTLVHEAGILKWKDNA